MHSQNLIMLTTLTVKFQTGIWLHVYMMQKGRMAQQKSIVHLKSMALQVKNFSTKIMNTIKATVLQHLASEGKVLAI